MRRATIDSSQAANCQHHFYPRSPCGERRQNPGKHYVAFRFLSTLSLRRATREKPRQTRTDTNFYPRSPCGERRVTVLGIQHKTGISIHALLAESDIKPLLGKVNTRDFYPRSPCGERRILLIHIIGFLGFLSTLSLRRATVHYDNYNLHCVISIHALLAESDSKCR